MRFGLIILWGSLYSSASLPLTVFPSMLLFSLGEISRKYQFPKYNI